MISSPEFQKSLADLQRLKETNPQAYAIVIIALEKKAARLMTEFFKYHNAH